MNVHTPLAYMSAVRRSSLLLFLLALACFFASHTFATPLKPGVKQTRVLFIGTEVLLHAPASHARASIPSYLSLIMRNLGLTPEIHTRLVKDYTIGPNPWHPDYDPTQMEHMRDVDDEEAPPMKLTWPNCRGEASTEKCDDGYFTDPTPPHSGEVSGSTKMVEVERFIKSFKPQDLGRSHCFDAETRRLLTEGAEVAPWDYIILQDDLRSPYLDYMLLNEAYLGVFQLMNLAVVKSPRATFIWVDGWAPPLSNPFELPPAVSRQTFPDASQPKPGLQILTDLSEVMGFRVAGWSIAHILRDARLHASLVDLAKDEAAGSGEPVRDVPPMPFQFASFRPAPVADAWKIFKMPQSFNGWNPADTKMLKEFKANNLLTETKDSEYGSAVGNYLAAVTIATQMLQKDPSCENLANKRACGYSIYCPTTTFGTMMASFKPAQTKAICHALREAVKMAVLRTGYLMEPVSVNPPAAGYTSVSERDEPSWSWKDDEHGVDNGPPPEGGDTTPTPPPPTTPDNTAVSSTAAAPPTDGTTNSDDTNTSTASDDSSPPPSEEGDSTSTDSTGADNNPSESDNSNASEKHDSEADSISSSTGSGASEHSEVPPTQKHETAEVSPPPHHEASTASHSTPPPTTVTKDHESSTGLADGQTTKEEVSHGGDSTVKPIISIPDTADKYGTLVVVVVSVATTLVIVAVLFLLCYWYRSRKMIPYSLLNYSTQSHQPPMVLVDEMDDQLNEMADQEEAMWAQVDGSLDTDSSAKHMREFKKQQKQTKKESSRR